MYDGYIWNGADDNASGTVGVMTLAKAFMANAKKPAVNLVFAAWTGEEKGLLGSKYYVNNTPKEHGKVVLNINFDMISRDSPKDSLGNEFSVSYLKGFNQLKEISETTQKAYEPGMKLKMRESSGKGGGSDNAPFAAKGIPFLSYMAGFHEDYHNPGDEVSKANFNKMLSILRHAYMNIYEIQEKRLWQKK
jgi:Zn-dependent M28 family amino/carboxypeptidase